jgi:pimeloyl-ACP methyl ester carboxylesterase
MPSSAKTVDFRQQANGVMLHGVAAGPEEGPLVILLHGFPEFWWAWRHQIGPLSEAGLRVLAPDQRGYNLSSKPVEIASYDLDTLAADVIALADAFGGGKVRLVGHDWGGLVAWWAASHYPDRIERLAILNAPHPAAAGSYLRANPTQALKSSYIAFFQLPFVPEAVLRANDFALMQLALLRSSRPGIFTDDVLARYRKAWAEPGALTAMLNWYRALRRRPNLRDSRIGVPTLVIWGEQDRFLERGLAEASLALCDAGRPVWFETATHWVHLEEPEEVSAELVEFLAG